MTDAQELFMAWLAIGNNDVPAFAHKRAVDSCIAEGWVDMDADEKLTAPATAPRVSPGAVNVAAAFRALYKEKARAKLLKRLESFTPEERAILADSLTEGA